jgi:hypothetical protein
MYPRWLLGPGSSRTGSQRNDILPMTSLTFSLQCDLASSYLGLCAVSRAPGREAQLIAPDENPPTISLKMDPR